MKFFVDNNLGIFISEGMKGFGEDFCHLTDIFKPDTPDIEWLSYIGSNDLFLITRDLRIRRNPLEQQAIRDYNVGAFFLFGKNRNKWELIQQLIRNWLRIKEYAEKTERPFAFRVPPKGIKIEKISI